MGVPAASGLVVMLWACGMKPVTTAGFAPAEPRWVKDTLGPPLPAQASLIGGRRRRPHRPLKCRFRVLCS
jgi:hypothetical protein